MTDPVARFFALRELPVRRVLGLNSGTSCDAVDAALVELRDEDGGALGVTVAAFAQTPLDPALSARLLAAGRAPADELAVLDVAVAEAFAAAARALLDAHGPAHLVGSHGQTVVHLPRSAGHVGATLQIGRAAVIAERLGLPVVSDFRGRDVAAGGEGAPVVPLADAILFGRAGRTRAIQNIGGIANITVLGPGLAEPIAFDTGPGNMPLDEVARVASGGTERYDAGGARAARGRVDAALLAELHALPFFALPPPRSTGREAFGRAWLEPLLVRYTGRLDDLCATLTRFAAEAIHRSYTEHVAARGVARLSELLVSGGGVKNAVLMAHLAELFAPVPVRSTADAEERLDPAAREAVAFAILAHETLFGRAGNVPAATGARGPRVLGTITP